MKRDPNRETGPASPDFSLPKSGILRGKRNFERLFERATVLKSPSLHFRYRVYKEPQEGCRIGFIASKRLGNAVTRNRVKRLLRESYRTHQAHLAGLFATRQFGFHGVLIAKSPDLTLQRVNEELIPLLERTRQHLSRISEGETPHATNKS
ncbi:MAG: ribonuclease P protein component [Balneolaceae bacterium]